MASTYPTEPGSSRPAAVEQTAPGAQRLYTRFDLSQRIEHIFLLASFTILGITGLAQKYASSTAGETILGLLGGIQTSRIIHRSAAVVLLAVSIYHIVAVLYRIWVKRHSISMLPTVTDFVHLYHDVLYYLGRRARKAYYGRYSYAEKVEYLAVVWGTVIMTITGFMMWNPIATTRWLPGDWIPAAKAAHGGEALLAVLSIILWHFYHVHIRHFNKSMFTGKMTEEEMRHEHPAELAAIEAGKIPAPLPAQTLRRRQRLFFPVAALLVGIMGYGLYQFVTFEQTAIATVPLGETGPVFVPLVPTPTPTPVPSPTLPPQPAAPGAPVPTVAPGQVVGVSSWQDAARLLSQRCATCHVREQQGGLSLATYPDALEGGGRGPGIVPNNPDNSTVVQVQQAGGHPGMLAPEELRAIVAWIQSGAPEQFALAGTPGPAGAASSWEGGIAQLMQQRCGACHIQGQLGGLSLASFQEALQGGSSGPGIVPGSANDSLIVQVQSEGGHPGQFTQEELATLVRWVLAGAPEQ